MVTINRTTQRIVRSPVQQSRYALPTTRSISSSIRNSSIYQTFLGNPGRRFWTAASAVNAIYLGSFLADNLDLVINTALAGDLAGSLLYAIHMASFCFFSVLAVTMPTVTHLSKFFLKPDAKPAAPKEKDLPTITVQIPCRNEPFSVVVENALGSALRLDYPVDKIEIQVLDNSDAGKYEELEQYCREHNVVFIHRDGIEGAKARNLNIGLSQARGDYILMLDADNRTDPDFLKNLATEVVRNPSKAYVVSSVDFWNKDKNLFTKSLAAVNLEFRSMNWALDNYGMTPFNGFGILLNRKTMAEVGNWNENMIGEDYDLALRLYAAGHKGKRVSHTHVHDAIPENLTRYSVQQRRWAFGSVQNIYEHMKDIVFGKGMSWNEKLDILYRFTYYPGLSGLMLVPALISAPLALLSEIKEGGDVNPFFNWWMAAWAISTAQPFLSYLANKSSGLFNGTKRSLRYFFPGILASMGALPEISKGILSFIRGNDEGFRITPKGSSLGSSFFQSLNKHRAELLFGATVAGGIAADPIYTGLFTFLGLGLFISPVLSWLGERRVS